MYFKSPLTQKNANKHGLFKHQSKAKVVQYPCLSETSKSYRKKKKCSSQGHLVLAQLKNGLFTRQSPFLQW